MCYEIKVYYIFILLNFYPLKVHIQCSICTVLDYMRNIDLTTSYCFFSKTEYINFLL